MNPSSVLAADPSASRAESGAVGAELRLNCVCCATVAKAFLAVGEAADLGAFGEVGALGGVAIGLSCVVCRRTKPR